MSENAATGGAETASPSSPGVNSTSGSGVPVVELADEPVHVVRDVFLRLLAPDLDALGEQPARGDGVQAEQEPVKAGDAHAAAGFLGEVLIRGREAARSPSRAA